MTEQPKFTLRERQNPPEEPGLVIEAEMRIDERNGTIDLILSSNRHHAPQRICTINLGTKDGEKAVSMAKLYDPHLCELLGITQWPGYPGIDFQ